MPAAIEPLRRFSIMTPAAMSAFDSNRRFRASAFEQKSCECAHASVGATNGFNLGIGRHRCLPVDAEILKAQESSTT